MNDHVDAMSDALNPKADSAMLPFIKGHGTGNDFIIIDDLAEDYDFSPLEVAALCDRRRGIGADGVLRVIKQDGIFFMDYRNADGSVAETCGNGLRVFCTHLFHRGWLESGEHIIGTRGGNVSVVINSSGLVTVNMGAAKVLASDCSVTIAEGRTFKSQAISMPNPHCVAIVDSLADAGALVGKPSVSADVFPSDANIEFVQIHDRGHITMRVWERGVGETLSCGSGACAAAHAAAAHLDLSASWSMRVDVPGGTLQVSCDSHSDLHLSGPAVLVAQGWIDRAALSHPGSRADS